MKRQRNWTLKVLLKWPFLVYIDTALIMPFQIMQVLILWHRKTLLIVAAVIVDVQAVKSYHLIKRRFEWT